MRKPSYMALPMWAQKQQNEEACALLMDNFGGVIGSAKTDAEADYIVNAVNTHARLVEALEACLEWIDAVPDDTRLPAMPGFERDDVDMLIAAAKGDSHD